jgi:hypothetical protein
VAEEVPEEITAVVAVRADSVPAQGFLLLPEQITRLRLALVVPL